jgi:hypothetical protein
MQGILYEESSAWLFLLVTVVMGGWAAWMTGKACAQTWRSYASLVFYCLVLGFAVRFIHFSMFEGTLLSLHYYVIDTIVVAAIASIGFRYTRTSQMVNQYHWLYERAGPLSWKDRSPA